MAHGAGSWGGHQKNMGAGKEGVRELLKQGWKGECYLGDGELEERKGIKGLVILD